METVYHEQQDGSLCAQHALNSLLQGSYFTAVDLGDIARQLDAQEAAAYAEGGTRQPRPMGGSNNMDDSGFFSVQVLSAALAVWDLQLVPLDSHAVAEAKANPVEQRAFICNLAEHWFTLRRFAGRYWLNLDSTKPGPETVSDGYLALLLAQLRQEGYSLFVVCGVLPTCEADQLLSLLLPSQHQESGRTSGSSQRPSQQSAQPQEQAGKPVEGPGIDELRRRRLLRFQGP